MLRSLPSSSGAGARPQGFVMAGKTLYRAAFVLPVTSPPIRDGFVLVEDGIVVSVGPMTERPDGAGTVEVDLGSSILCPGFVNAHTHLELSHLKGAVPGVRGFVPWIEDQLRVRAEHQDDDAGPSIQAAIRSMESAGTVAVADVSNSLVTLGPLAESGLSALVLHEILGFDPGKAEVIFAQARSQRETAFASLPPAGPGAASGGGRIRLDVAAHAPHSVSRRLLELLNNDGGVRSIHVAESRSEDDFLKDGRGEWREFLDRRVGAVPFDPPGRSPVRYLDDLGVLKLGLLAVHCVRVDADDAKLLAERKAVAVLCPRSNEFLGNGVPPLALLLGSGVRVAFGTDSLASCPSLDVIDDARMLARKFPRVPKAALLHALTRAGAFSLGFADLGEIQAGAQARFAAVSFEGAPPVDPLAFLFNEGAPARGVA